MKLLVSQERELQVGRGGGGLGSTGRETSPSDEVRRSWGGPRDVAGGC